MKYATKHISEIFSPEFMEYIPTTLQGEPADAKVLNQIMREIEHYEMKRKVEFVSWFGIEYIIFKSASV